MIRSLAGGGRRPLTWSILPFRVFYPSFRSSLQQASEVVCKTFTTDRRRCAGCSPRVTTPCAEPVCRAGSYTSASTTRTPSSRVPSFSRSACNCAPGELLTADCSRKASTVLTALPRAGQQPADELSRAQHTLPYKAAPAEHCPPLPAHLHDHVGSNTVRCM